MSLHENAAKLAGRTDKEKIPSTNGVAEAPAPAEPPAPLPEIDEPDVDHEVADVPAVVAWARVMREVRAIAKKDKFDGGRGGKFDFRGIDRVVNDFGPAVRRHGVLVIPHKVEPSYRDIKTSSGGNMRQCDVIVTWRIYGPRGDHIEAQTAGEGLDTGGRSTTKAQTIAERVLFLVAGVVPTEDADPESQNVERGEALVRTAASYRDEALDPSVSLQRLFQMHRELDQQRMLGQTVVNEVGDDEAVGALVKRIGNQLREGGA